MTTIPNQRRLTFAQREAGAPTLDLLKRDDIPRVLRIKLYALISSQIRFTSTHDQLGNTIVAGQWSRILYDAHIEFHEELPDDYKSSLYLQTEKVKDLFVSGPFFRVYGFLEYTLRHPAYTLGFAEQLVNLLEREQAPYRIVGGDTFVPYTSDADLQTVNAALADTANADLKGVHAHYTAAAEALGKGDYAGSMRESIHSVESLTKLLTGKATLQDGVKALAKEDLIHTTVQAALEKIAAWTNAVSGIRHANNAASAVPAVDEHDAAYLLALCGATLTFLKRRASKVSDLASPKGG